MIAGRADAATGGTEEAQTHDQTQAEGKEKEDVITQEDDNLDTIDFVTLGMFIIDEIEYLPPRPPVQNILGGGGSYSALGARLFSPPPLSRSVGWIVDQGSDFPPSITSLITSWQTSVLLRPDPSRLTTRGWNGYVDSSERRAFRYTTPKKRLTAADLVRVSPPSSPSTPSLLHARAIHMVCSPARCRELVADISARRKQLTPDHVDYTKPFIIWEPVPDRCVPDELLNCTNCLPLVDICSPNHAELAGFMGSDGLDPVTGEISTAAVEQACEQLLASMPLQSYALVVRAGEKGCYIARNGGRKRASKRKKLDRVVREKKPKKDYARGGLSHDTDMEALFAGMLQDEEGFVAREEIEVDPGIERWIPAYYQREEGGDVQLESQPQEEVVEVIEVVDSDMDDDDGSEWSSASSSSGIDDSSSETKNSNSKVVDPTGGGNTFLGALAVALARGKTIEEACAWGSVAASFAIEQVGVPVLGTDEQGRETWNGARVEERLDQFQARLLL
ncbi:putative MAK32 protein [Bombardia bombarda]|uniref:MAK32 protein n=1 Tax=Bombardia bombarda TaxID=252184 RepID=A0AA39XP75_9PEZI|nr:putative MAK32 protein [Bombardia bombarda]